MEAINLGSKKVFVIENQFEKNEHRSSGKRNSLFATSASMIVINILIVIIGYVYIQKSILKQCSMFDDQVDSTKVLFIL